MLAEDVELNREVAVKLLNMVGIEVSCAEDGYEAVRAIRKSSKPDALTVPVFAMTANAFSEDVTAVMDAGMNGHIAKPIETEILYETLQEVFKSREQV